MLRLRKRKGGAGKHRPRNFDHRPNHHYTNRPLPATPGPILATHFFRGCELLEVAL